MTVSRLKGETQTPLFHIPGRAAWYISLSSDGNWLAIVTKPQTEPNGQTSPQSTDSMQLFVFSLASQTLYPLSSSCSFGVCFTGPNRLGYVRADGKDLNHGTGAVVEVTLDDARATALERIVSLSMDYQRGVGLVQFRNGVDAVIASSGYRQLIEKLLEIL